MRCKPHLTLCLRCWNADASHTQNLAKLARLRRPRHLASNVEPLAFNLRRGLRRSYVSPRLCKCASLFARDALPFNQLMRNFKRYSACYDHKKRNFDRIELRRRSRRKDKNSKRDRRNAPQSEARREPARSAPEGAARGCATTIRSKNLRMRSICVQIKVLRFLGLTHIYARSLQNRDRNTNGCWRNI